MAYSIQKGLREVPKNSKAVAILPGDCPAISPLTIRFLNQTFLHLHRPMLIPTHQGQQGHPRYIGRDRFGLIQSLPNDAKFSDIFKGATGDVLSYEIGDESIIMDADTPNNYETLLRWGVK